MKQIILSILMVIMTSLTFGQSKTITPNVSLFYGTQNTFGVDFVAGKNDIVYGGGVSFMLVKVVSEQNILVFLVQTHIQMKYMTLQLKKICRYIVSSVES